MPGTTRRLPTAQQGTGICVFHQGQSQNGQLWCSSFNGGNWYPDTIIPNVGMSFSPSAVVYGNGIFVFHQGQSQNTQLWYSYYDGESWYPDTIVPNVGMAFSPSAIVSGGGIYVFHQGWDYFNGGPDNLLWYSYFDGTNWAPDTSVPNLLMWSSPSAIPGLAGGICVFHQGATKIGISQVLSPDGQLWYSYANDFPNWAPDTLVPNVGVSESPSATIAPSGGISVFHQGSGESGQLWYSTWGIDDTWAPDAQVPNLLAPPAPIMSDSPSAVPFGGGITVFYQGLGENGQLWYSYFDGANWQPQTQVPNVGMSGAPSAVLY